MKQNLEQSVILKKIQETERSVLKKSYLQNQKMQRNLAIAIGTAHGIYPKDFVPHLEQELLTEIKNTVSIPLVLHGGSANPDSEIAEAVKRGVNKINISSDIKDAFYQQLRKTLGNDPVIREPFDLYLESIDAMKEVVNQKIDLFNDADKMKYYKL